MLDYVVQYTFPEFNALCGYRSDGNGIEFRAIWRGITCKLCLRCLKKRKPAPKRKGRKSE